MLTIRIGGCHVCSSLAISRPRPFDGGTSSSPRKIVDRSLQERSGSLNGSYLSAEFDIGMIPQSLPLHHAPCRGRQSPRTQQSREMGATRAIVSKDRVTRSSAQRARSSDYHLHGYREGIVEVFGFLSIACGPSYTADACLATAIVFVLYGALLERVPDMPFA